VVAVTACGHDISRVTGLLQDSVASELFGAPRFRPYLDASFAAVDAANIQRNAPAAAEEAHNPGLN